MTEPPSNLPPPTTPSEPTQPNQPSKPSKPATENPFEAKPGELKSATILGMPMTEKQKQEFYSNLEKMIGLEIKRQMDQWKQNMEDMKKSWEEP